MQRSITIINGPNLNMLGSREPEIYGKTTLADIEKHCVEHAKKLGFSLDFHQSNHEGDLVDWIQQAGKSAAGLIVNAGGYTHTSVAIHDALKTVNVPIIEVHLSNIYQRESFRHHSYISPLARAVICGLGAKGYVIAIDALADLIGR
jgi:3-dehydroquinate dehydratase-2